MINRSNRNVIFVDSAAYLTSRIAKRNYIYIVLDEGVAYYWDDGYYPLTGYSLSPFTRSFSNVNVATLNHGMYKEIPFYMRDSNGEPIIPHKIVRREEDLDAYIYPKTSGEAIFYP